MHTYSLQLSVDGDAFHGLAVQIADLLLIWMHNSSEVDTLLDTLRQGQAIATADKVWKILLFAAAGSPAYSAS